MNLYVCFFDRFWPMIQFPHWCVLGHLLRKWPKPYDPPPESIYWREQRRQLGFGRFKLTCKTKRPCGRTLFFSVRHSASLFKDWHLTNKFPPDVRIEPKTLQFCCRHSTYHLPGALWANTKLHMIEHWKATSVTPWPHCHWARRLKKSWVILPANCATTLVTRPQRFCFWPCNVHPALKNNWLQILRNIDSGFCNGGK